MKNVKKIIGHIYGTRTFSSTHQNRERNLKFDPGKYVLMYTAQFLYFLPGAPKSLNLPLVTHALLYTFKSSLTQKLGCSWVVCVDISGLY